MSAARFGLAALFPIATPGVAAQRACPAASGEARAVVSLSLTDAVTMASRTSPLVEAGRARVLSRQAAARMAASATSPRLDASIGLVERSYNAEQQGRGPLPGEPTPVVGPFPNEDLRLAVRAPLLARPENLSHRAAIADVRGEEAAARAVAEEEVDRASRAYVTLARAEAECAYRLDELTIAERVHAVARDRVRLGATARADSMGTAIEVAMKRAALLRARIAKDSAAVEVALVTGQSADNAFQLTDPLDVLARLPVDTTVALSTAERTDAGLAALRARATAVQLRVGAAGATRRYPVITAGGDAGMNARDPARAYLTTALSLTASMPVFDGGAVRAREERAAADALAADAAVREAVEAFRGRWERSRMRLRESEATLAAAEQAALLAADAQADVEERYRRGDVGILDLTTSMQKSAGALSLVDQARAEVALARLAWRRLSGVLDVRSLAEDVAGRGGEP